jgi:hypothetical protein
MSIILLIVIIIVIIIVSYNNNNCNDNSNDCVNNSNSNKKYWKSNLKYKKKLKRDKIEKEFQFYKLFQIKKIIKRTWIKYKGVTDWKVVLKS